jgi:hypothetical protein
VAPRRPPTKALHTVSICRGDVPSVRLLRVLEGSEPQEKRTSSIFGSLVFVSLRR